MGIGGGANLPWNETENWLIKTLLFRLENWSQYKSLQTFPIKHSIESN